MSWVHFNWTPEQCRMHEQCHDADRIQCYDLLSCYGHLISLYSPPDWSSKASTIHAWYNSVMVEIHLALEPVTPRAN